MPYKAVEDRRACRKRMRERNPEKHRAAFRAWYSPDRFREANLRYRTNHPERYLVNHARVRARKLGVDFDLTEADLHVPAVCPVFGTPLVWGVGQRGARNAHSPSLDRLDPNKGYVRGNVRVISNRANRLKNDATAAELRAIADYIDRELGA